MSRVVAVLCVLALAPCSCSGSTSERGGTGLANSTASGGSNVDSESSAADPSSGETDSYGTSSSTSGSAESGAVTTADGGIKFDASGGANTAGNSGGDCDCGNRDWSYLWTANSDNGGANPNSDEGTVSKVDTRTLTEEGRYLARPDGLGSPVGTSVSIDGKAVAVANSNVGIVKIWARPEFCKGGNTSTGKNDVKAWGQEDCVAWFIDFPGKTVQRAVQWTSGTFNPATCQYEHQKIWTTTAAMGWTPGWCGPSGVWVHRLDGDTGAVEHELHLPEEVYGCRGDGDYGWGPWGGAVDAEGNFWIYSRDTLQLARIDFDTLAYKIFSGGDLGIAVDTRNRLWTTEVRRFDYATGIWASAMNNLNVGSGIAQDFQGRMWVTGGVGAAGTIHHLTWMDMETLAIGDTIMLPSEIASLSVDIDGYIWAVDFVSTAYKIHPDSYLIESYDGLTYPNTYSDMTGGALNNVTCDPAG